MSGLGFRVGYGWKYDAFPNNSLYDEDRMLLFGDDDDEEEEKKKRRLDEEKEYSVEDLFPKEPEPATTFK